MSSARHAVMAGEDVARELCAQLTDEELNVIRGWHEPTDTKIDGYEISYADADKELRLGLTENGAACEYDDPDRVSRGIVDMAWERGDLAIVVDAKKSLFTSEADSMQMIASGLAYASYVGASEVRVGLWCLEEGMYVWGPRFAVMGLDAAALTERVVYAATNTSGPTLGPHCNKCWQRLVCPEYLVKLEDAGDLLEPFTRPGAITEENAVAALLAAKRVAATAEVVEKTVKAFATQHGALRDGQGRIYRPTQVRGRESVSLKVLRDNFGAEVEPYITRGKGYQRFDWVKEK